MLEIRLNKLNKFKLYAVENSSWFPIMRTK